MVDTNLQKLNELARQIRICKKCSLYLDTNNAVPGEGNPNAKIMFIGEGPGFNEDRLGRPFVGAAGHLLEELISSINLTRNEVFITNVVKHRPPENRDPALEEITACDYWLNEQIAVICPEIIVTLGRFSMAKFLKGVTISRVHGTPRNVNGKIIMPMFHPAAALRDQRTMLLLKEDFRKITLLLNKPKIEEQKVEPITDQISLDF